MFVRLWHTVGETTLRRKKEKAALTAHQGGFPAQRLLFSERDYSMSEQLIQNLRHKVFVPQVTERWIGWQCYAEKMPVDVCGTEQMRSGWLAAWRAESDALTSQVCGNGSEVSA